MLLLLFLLHADVLMDTVCVRIFALLLLCHFLSSSHNLTYAENNSGAGMPKALAADRAGGTNRITMKSMGNLVRVLLSGEIVY
jgi:hypothetical protein